MADREYDPKKMLIGDLEILFCALLWGVSFAATKEVLDHMGPLWLLAFRFSLCAVLIGLISPKRVKTMTKETFRVGWYIGLLLLAGMVLQTIGIQFTTTGKSAFITATYVVMVPFITWLWDRKSPGIKDFGASILCMTGMGAITLEKGAFTMGLGEALTLACALAFAVQFLVIDRMAQNRDALTLTMIETGVSALFCLAGALIWEPWPDLRSPAVWGWLSYLVVGCTLVPYSLQIRGQQLTSPTHASILLMMESVFAMIVGIIFLKEPVTSRILWGCSLVFLSILITELDLSGLFKAKTETR